MNSDSPIWSGKNYTLTVVSEDQLELQLLKGSKWSEQAGDLMVTGIHVGDENVEYSGKGLQAATILEDPVVKANEMHIYNTHTKHYHVRGSSLLADLDAAKFDLQVA